MIFNKIISISILWLFLFKILKIDFVKIDFLIFFFFFLDYYDLNMF
jgi:hypothetical protein